MNILLSNDDGIEALGILALATELATIAEIYVVAPSTQQSGTSHGISVGIPLIYQEVNLAAPVKKAWSVAGTPADCTKLALEEFLAGIEIDLVVSGINLGSNLGTDVFYSGTIAAAFEGYVLGIPALAISVDSPTDACNFQDIAIVCAKFVEWWQGRNFMPHTLFNLNFPVANMVAADNLQAKKMKFTTLGKRVYREVFTCDKVTNKCCFIMGGTPYDDLSEETADVYWSNQGYVTATALGADLTNYGAYQNLANLDIGEVIF